MRIINFRFEQEPLEAFLAFPGELYRGDPQYLPLESPLMFAEQAPFFRYGRHRHFLAYDGNQVVGRVTASINTQLDPGVGQIGFFEVVEDPSVSQALIQEAEAWLKQEGCREVWGPIDFSIWYRYRFMTEGFEHPTFFTEPYNKRYYPAYFELAGYAPIRQWASTLGTWEILESARETYRKRYERAKDLGFLIRPLEDLDADLKTIYPLLVQSFQNFKGYFPIQWEEFVGSVGSMKQIVDPQTAFLVYDPDHQPVAFQITLPDVRPGLSRPRYIQQFTGRLPEGKKRTVGLGKALLYATLDTLIERGVPTDVVAALMSDHNHSRGLASGVTVPMRTYTLYGKAL